MRTDLQKDTTKNTLSTSPLRSPFSLIDSFLENPIWDPFDIMTPNLFRSQRLANVSTIFPKVDVEETENEIKVTANIPGVNPEDINLEVGDDYISLSGKIEKENKKTNTEGKIYRYEREFGEFRREFSLPARVDKSGIVAKSKNGVLTISLPKSEEEKKRVKIEIE